MRDLYPQKNKEAVSTPWEATQREYGGLAVLKELLRTAKKFFFVAFFFWVRATG